MATTPEEDQCSMHKNLVNSVLCMVSEICKQTTTLRTLNTAHFTLSQLTPFQLAVAATNQTATYIILLRSDWSQPRRTGSQQRVKAAATYICDSFSLLSSVT